MTYVDLVWENGDFRVDSAGDLALERGVDVIRTDLIARLGSPRGSHWAWPDEGTDLAIYINAVADPLSLLALRQDVELEVVRDTRLLDAAATVDTVDLRSGRVTVTAELTSGALVTLGIDVPSLLKGGGPT